jgi:hypothetical protein
MTDSDELNQKLAEYGVERFVRNIILKTLIVTLYLCKEYGGKPEKTDEVIEEMNHRIIEEFTILARAASKRMFEQIGELLKEEK